jgi:ATP-dependent Clp protease adaptor protein ClpS
MPPECERLKKTSWRACNLVRFWERFELGESYVSLLAMSPRRQRGRAELAEIGLAPALSVTQDPTVTTEDKPGIEKETRSKESLDLPWQVVVHNDPVNLMTYVTMVFQRVFGFPREKAEKHMLEVHQNGRSILWSGMRERGELYVQQLHAYLLLATLEKID